MSKTLEHLNTRIKTLDDVIASTMKLDGNYHGDCSAVILLRNELLTIRSILLDEMFQRKG